MDYARRVIYKFGLLLCLASVELRTQSHHLRRGSWLYPPTELRKYVAILCKGLFFCDAARRTVKGRSRCRKHVPNLTVDIVTSYAFNFRAVPGVWNGIVGASNLSCRHLHAHLEFRTKPRPSKLLKLYSWSVELDSCIFIAC